MQATVKAERTFSSPEFNVLPINNPTLDLRSTIQHSERPTEARIYSQAPLTITAMQIDWPFDSHALDCVRRRFLQRMSVTIDA